MEKFEIKKLGLKSVFKVSIYFLAIPMAFFAFIGLLMVLAGIVMQQSEISMIGVVYVVMFLFIMPFSAGMYVVIAAFYNLLASKFGGLELTLEPKDNKLE